MNAIEKTKELALLRCIDTKERYFDALFGVVSDTAITWPFLSAEETYEGVRDFFYFEISVKDEWVKYDEKMRKAGMR